MTYVLQNSLLKMSKNAVIVISVPSIMKTTGIGIYSVMIPESEDAIGTELKVIIPINELTLPRNCCGVFCIIYAFIGEKVTGMKKENIKLIINAITTGETPKIFILPGMLNKA